MNKRILENLQQKSLDYQEWIIRLAQQHTFGIHIGGSLSLAEILTVLYFEVASVDPRAPDWLERDRIFLSKGHANVGLLTILAMRGFFSFERFQEFNLLGSHYSMHSDSRVPGVEHSTGSLGHGLSVAVGSALAGKRGQKNWQVYCILGDGELMEGSVWEAMMSASHYQLDNLTAIIDRNYLTQESNTESVMSLEPLKAKVSAFGWQPFEVDGHNVEALWQAFHHKVREKPKMIIANTVKGHGIPSHENIVRSHFAHLTEEQARAALEQIRARRIQLATDIGSEHG
jgi:transketolase